MRYAFVHTLTVIIVTGVVIGCAGPIYASAVEPDCHAQVTPPFLGEQAPPLVMLVLSRDHKLYYEAYNDASDVNGDGLLDIAYDHGIDYYGYFDPNKCYVYQAGGGGDSAFFDPVSVTPDKFCSAGQWSGNVLNWLTMSRMDVMRKVLYGGYRHEDTAAGTILKRVYIPQDAHSWGKEVTGRLCYDSGTGSYGKMCSCSSDCGGGRVCQDKSAQLLGIPTPASASGGEEIDPVAARSCKDGAGNPQSCRFAVVRYDNNGSQCGDNHSDMLGDFNPASINAGYPRYLDTAYVDPNHDEGNAYNLLMISYFYVAPGQAGTWNFAVDSDDGSEVEIDGNVVTSWYGCHDDCGVCTSYSGTVALGAGWHKFIARLGEAGGEEGIIVFYRKPGDSSWKILGNGPEIAFAAPELGSSATAWIASPCFISQGVGIDDPLIAPYNEATSCPCEGGRQHLFCSTTLSENGVPILRRVTDRSERIWEWSSKEQAVCNDPGNTRGGYPFGRTWPTDFTVRVRVCDPHFPEENCKVYPGPDGVMGTGDEALKPVGLLQRYGEQEEMYFGLLTGSYNKNYSGGVIRKPIGTILDEINQNTGQFTAVSGIIDTINRLRTTNFNYGNYNYTNCGWVTNDAPGQGTCEMWGNPVGEMMYEATRYFSGKSEATPAFRYSGGVDHQLGLPAVWSWNNPYDTFPYCSQAVMLVLSDINPSRDTDQVPGAAFPVAHGSGSNLGDTLGGLNTAALADTIGIDEGYAGHSVFIGENSGGTDFACTAKDAGIGFGEIRGLCPEEPTKEGGYSGAAVAWYGHATDLFPDEDGFQDILTYSVGLASPLPEINIRLGTEASPRWIKVVPYAKSLGGCLGVWARCQGGSGGYCPTNQIVDFFATEISPTHGVFRVNFEDVEQGADHDMDAIVLYEYEVVDESHVRISLQSSFAAGCIDQVLGFVISGTNGEDGAWLPVRDLDASAGSGGCVCNASDPSLSTGMYDNNTPCSVACLPTLWSRVFETGSSSATLVENPLWYAAKWGGFQDSDSEGPGLNKPDKDFEWDQDHDGVPDTYFYVTNAGELEKELERAFQDILNRASSGTAASVISASRGGEGALYQAMFWPKLPGVQGTWVSWIGDVHALLIDELGGVYEDTNINGALDSGDERVTLFYDENERRTLVCYGEMSGGSCSGSVREMEQVRYLWSVSEWLNQIPEADISVNRFPYQSNDTKRYIFTWDDLDTDGIVDNSEIFPFEERDWSTLAVSGGRGPVPLDFGVETSDEVNTIIRYVRGEDMPGLRPRAMLMDLNKDGLAETPVIWRLSDVIHSTPMAVSAPAENYDILYSDESYTALYELYQHRRQVIYFGGNDGMLHAINGGFHDSSAKKFCRTVDCSSEDSGLPLGAELWAYVPYNILPHLKCLTDPGYGHQYYVDLRPRIFDVQIFTPDDTHPRGWGTILVGGMRFGGTPVFPGDLDLDGDLVADYSGDSRELRSAYFILDITNPEQPPVLLGEFTSSAAGAEADLGYTTLISTVTPMKEGMSTDWYLILGNGPTTFDGESMQNGRVCTFPLDWLVGAARQAVRIPNAPPSAGSEAGCFTLPDSNSFVSDLITVDFDLDEEYKADAVYFGTVSGSTGNWAGKMYRLVTRKIAADGTQVNVPPSQWAALLPDNPVPLIDVGQPVTSAATASWDGENYWIYFGTGRFLDTDDKVDAAQQSFYGIKEPHDCDGTLSFDSVEITGTSGPNSGMPGEQGLIRVDGIRVPKAINRTSAALGCAGGGTRCLPPGVSTFQDLIDYIAGTSCDDGLTGTDGWYRNFSRPRERNLGQATLLGGLLTYTTYQPFADPCLPEGLSYLSGVFYQTGTAWHEAVFGQDSVDGDGFVISEVDLGHGLASSPSLHVGQQDGGKAFVQTSTGDIVEVEQPNLPIKNVKSSRVSWHEDFAN
jgi:type IV pilus assembly protein PilY1